ncbi:MULTISPECIES: phosphatidylcholine/phosphatidylserine synthase [Mesorhizobium]|uniref:phosphatidylcholine/phosphatidylserine synthase n=1 Tax=Mesorhizobium TaxID=68287 RepID=UPI000A6A21C2|nr:MULTISPECIES: phosphatidylcholine/phosphatidylserine synthase [Mesorhizobium]
MIRYLFDAANAITALGLTLATTAIYFALIGRFEIGICFGLWALLADDADGMVAKSSPNRSALTAQLGGALDGLLDLVYAAVFPAVLILSFNAFSVSALLAANCLILSGALRLSYFSTFGLDADGFGRGLPLNNNLFVLALLFVADHHLPVQGLGNLCRCRICAVGPASFKLQISRYRQCVALGQSYTGRSRICRLAHKVNQFVAIGKRIHGKLFRDRNSHRL